MIVVDGRRINIAFWGDPQSPAVLLIHGMRDHCRSWDALAAKLSDEYRVIAPDLRGHGDSDWAGSESYALPAYAADMADVAEALQLNNFAIVGHSLGGAIGLRIAAAYPERVWAFVGIECVEMPIQRDEADEPTPYSARLRNWFERRQAAAAKNMRHYPSLEAASARMQQEQPDLPAATIAHLAKHAVVYEQGRGWRWKFDPRVRLRAPEDQKAHDLNEILQAVACPVLLCYSDDGWIPLPPPSRLAHLRRHLISRYPGGSHWLHHEFSERFATEVLSHLTSNSRMNQYA